MKIWNIAVDNKTTVYLLIVVILIFGYRSYQALPREAAPDITIPLVIVSTPYVGVSPSTSKAHHPADGAGAQGMKDLKQITSVSKEGLSTVRVEFNTGSISTRPCAAFATR